MTSKEYRELLLLPEWREFRKKFIDESGGKCEKCDTEGSADNPLEVHHKKYIDGRKPWEYSEDELMVLCKRCHEKLHHNLANCGKWVPVFDKDGKEITDAYKCKRCNGCGYVEYEFCDGVCLKCNGEGVFLRQAFTVEDTKLLADSVWAEAQRTGRTKNLKTWNDVYNWLLDIREMKEKPE